MSRNILTQANSNKYPPMPQPDTSWRKKSPVGSTVRMAVYREDVGWYWRKYKVLHYFPYVVKCIDRSGFIRCFGNWEFQRRQKGRVDHLRGGKGIQHLTNGDDIT